MSVAAGEEGLSLASLSLGLFLPSMTEAIGCNLDVYFQLQLF